ncbi:MAG: plastocyanin/azurin family copper-binding protein, partial [Gemmatimonadota bacterium]
MTRNWSRRDFVRATGRSLTALGALPLVTARPGRAASARTGRGGPGGPAGGTPSGLPPRVVGLRSVGGDFRFDPPGLRVEPGDELLWLNLGDFHTTTAFHPTHDDLLAADVPLRIPDGAEPWHSGTLGLSDATDFTYTFEVPGVYDYFCQPHYSFGMVGRVIAGEPRGGPAVTRPLSELNEASREEMPAVEAIVEPTGRTFEWEARLNGLLPLRSADGDVAGAARAVASAMADDDRLREALAGEDERVASRVDRVVEGAVAEAGVQELLTRIDAVREVFRSV